MQPFSLNIKGRLIAFTRPAVMAIINATPDSFYSASRVSDRAGIAESARKAISEGADIIDLGAYSSRPGAQDVSPDEEMRRLETAIDAVRSISTDIPLSIDTFRSRIAHRCISELGADIVNDISGGDLDSEMFETVADIKAPYILMHMRGTPATMQSLCDYPQGVTAGVIAELAPKLQRLSLLGVADVIVDPGFGFSKTLEQNYTMLRDLESRLLGITPEQALNATTVINTLAIERGAAVLRVHDVRAAREAVEICSMMQTLKP